MRDCLAIVLGQQVWYIDAPRVMDLPKSKACGICEPRYHLVAQAALYPEFAGQEFGFLHFYK
jgi:hypothetical protein